jgi:hypothetical protein
MWSSYFSIHQITRKNPQPLTYFSQRQNLMPQSYNVKAASFAHALFRIKGISRPPKWSCSRANELALLDALERVENHRVDCSSQTPNITGVKKRRKKPEDSTTLLPHLWLFSRCAFTSSSQTSTIALFSFLTSPKHSLLSNSHYRHHEQRNHRERCRYYSLLPVSPPHCLCWTFL